MSVFSRLFGRHEKGQPDGVRQDRRVDLEKRRAFDEKAAIDAAVDRLLVMRRIRQHDFPDGTTSDD